MTLNNRYKSRLLRRVVSNLDRLLVSGAANPRVRRSGCRAEGGQAYLLDAANFMKEWAAGPSEQNYKCWWKADCLPSDAVVELQRQLGEVHPFSDNVQADVSALAAVMANTTEYELDGLGDQAQMQGVRRLLMADSNVEAIDQTVDIFLAEEDENE